MLGRSLFEDMVVAHWAQRTPDETLLEKITRHEKSVALYFQSDARTLPSGLTGMPRLTEDNVREIEETEGISSRDAPSPLDREDAPPDGQGGGRAVAARGAGAPRGDA
jgi:hypothetical protein